MLDSKLSAFFDACKAKSEALTQEINSLKSENIDLEKIVKNSEAETHALEVKRNKLQFQYEHFLKLNKSSKSNLESTKERLVKAHNDYCNITKAHQSQRANINKAEEELNYKLEALAQSKKSRVENYKATLKMFSDKINEVKSIISNREQLNASARLELLEKDLKDSYRVSNIMELQRKYSTKA